MFCSAERKGEKKVGTRLNTRDARPPVYLPLTTLSDFASFHNPRPISTPPHTRICFFLSSPTFLSRSSSRVSWEYHPRFSLFHRSTVPQFYSSASMEGTLRGLSERARRYTSMLHKCRKATVLPPPLFLFYLSFLSFSFPLTNCKSGGTSKSSSYNFFLSFPCLLFSSVCSHGLESREDLVCKAI